MRKFCLWLLIFNFQAAQVSAAAQSALIRGADAPIVNYRAWLATQTRYQAYSEWWIRQRVSKQDEMKVEHALETAQMEFLQGGLERAKILFKDLTDQQHSRDWKAAHRKTFAYAHLRLAQLMESVEDKTTHIQLASAFGPVKLNSDLFPQPVWLEYQKQLSMQFEEQMDLDLWFPGIRYVLVDGRPFEAVATSRLPVDAQKHRFTLVFDHSAPVTLVTTWPEFKKWRPAASSFASGTCETAQFSRDIAGRNEVSVYIDDNCIKSPAGNVTPVSKPKELSPIGSDWQETPTITKNSGFNPWIWAGIGVLAAGAIVLLNQQADDRAEPTTTVGF